MEALVVILVRSLTPTLVVVVLLLWFPEKIEKWSALLWRCVSGSRSWFRFAHKKYVKHDLQGRVNDFLRRARSQMPSLADSRLSVEWVDPNTKRTAFIQGNEVIIRLRRDDSREHNFMHAAYLYIRTALLQRPKRYVSPSQREAIDLFACTRLLEVEKPSVLGDFLDEYLHPRTRDDESRVAQYVDDYAVLDGGGLFFPVFLQELEYLGEKVFGRRRDDRIVTEVDGVIEFLKAIAARTVGVDGDLDYEGGYCRFALVIVGKPSKLIVSIEPYVTFIRRALVARAFETIYVLARRENQSHVDAICAEFEGGYYCARKYALKTYLRYANRRELALQYLVVLRKADVQAVRASVA